MYEEIMRSSRNSFFALLNVVFPENSREVNSNNLERLSAEINNNIMKSIEENEWMQEYHIIYNSYILEGRETEEPEN